MNSLSRQKKQLEEDKEKLIGHIEAKLAELRQQRKRLEDPDYRVEESKVDQVPLESIIKEIPALVQLNQNKTINVTSNKVNGSLINHIKKPTTTNPTIKPENQKINKPQQKPNPNNKPKQHLTADEHFYLKHHQTQVQHKIHNLQQLYLKKKQLQAIGIIPSSPDQVQTLFNNPKTQKKLASHKPQVKLKKDQIVKQQMQRIELLLKKKKVNKHQQKQMTHHHYATLMQDKPYQLQKYEQLLVNNPSGKLSLVQKQQLVDVVFDTLKEFSGGVQKDRARDFMLANDIFAQVFFITQEEMYNDLDVYQTQTEGEMTRNQFYQFVKSIEVTNPMLNPGIRLQKMALSKPQTISASRISSSTTHKHGGNEFKGNKKQQQQQKQLKYQTTNHLTKLFQYLDQAQEGVVERQRFVIALKRGLLLDSKKQPLVKKEYVEQFGSYLERVRSSKNKKSYYMQLEGKFLGWMEVEDCYGKFVRGVDLNEKELGKAQEQSQHQSQTQEQDNFSHFPQQKPTPQPISIPQPIQKGSLQSYFQQFGWQPQPSTSHMSDLKKLDHYYKQMRQQYGNEIEWNNNIRDKLSLANNVEFAEDFSKLQIYIKEFEREKDEK